MRAKWIFAVAGMAVLSALLVQVGPAQQGKAKAVPAKQVKAIPPGDWPLYSRDLASDKFSPLTQINTTNVLSSRRPGPIVHPLLRHLPITEKAAGKGKVREAVEVSAEKSHPSSSMG